MSRRAELVAFGTEYDLDVILLSKTYLSLLFPFSFWRNATYRTDRLMQNNPARPRGSTATLVYRCIAHSQLPPPTTRRLEETAVALCVGDREVSLILAYLPHGPGGPPPPQEWDTLLDYSLSTLGLQLQAFDLEQPCH